MTHAYRPPPALAATDFWMLSHNEHTGQPLAPHRVVAIGLAAALLAELLLEERIGIHHDNVVPITAYPPRDALTHQVLDRLTGEEPLPVQVWLRHLTQTSYEAVAERMLRQRLVVKVGDRRLLGRSRITYRPVDPNVAGWPAARLHVFLREGRPFTESDAVLAGLAKAIGLHHRALEGSGRSTESYLDAVIASAGRPYHQLFAHTAAIVGSAVMAGR
ncbi:GOLPH3/VPS74 family protein [Dactylosporangium darangshiense]|uniref:GPP34 family phosphoprotein n=1 Tax=Dactylosporangium darangshiense TaxID=579108 RepID=A0ABP8CTU0_9ACTN